jgi:hypothetical protein
MMDKGVITLRDVADLASDELMELLGNDRFSERNAIQIVMTARRDVYGI